MNVLISSVSKKIPLIKAVRTAMQKLEQDARTFGADTDNTCLGRYFVDEFWRMPRLSEVTPESFISYCQFHKISHVIPTRDGELLFYALNREKFAQEGIHTMISSEESISLCLDKLQLFQTLNKLGYPTIKTTTNLDDLECASYVVKERYGAGGLRIGLDLSHDQAVEHAQLLDIPVFQPYIEGDEVSVDLYLDKSGHAKGVILRRRDYIANGESQVTTSFHDETLEQLCVKMAEDLKLYGHVMFQLIQSEKTYVLECNPRFGGASPLSLAMGLDSFYWFFLESTGKDLSKHPFERSTIEKRLIRYAEDLILP